MRTFDMRQGPARPADPRNLLTASGIVPYRWDLASDRIQWGVNAAEVLGLGHMAAWSSGADFEALIEAAPGPLPREAVLGSAGRDGGAGVAYSLSYRIRSRTDRASRVVETGRWFADAEGRPARAVGSLRVAALAGAEEREARERSLFLQRVSAALSGQARARLTIMVLALAAEDAATVAAAEGRLAATMRRRDDMVRLEPGRLALLLRGCGPDEVAPAERRLVEAIGAGVAVAGGTASYPDHALEAPALLRRAERTAGAVREAVVAPVVPGLAPDLLDLLNGRRVQLALIPAVEAATRQPAFAEAVLRAPSASGGWGPAEGGEGSLARLVEARRLELVAEALAADPALRLSTKVPAASIEDPDWLLALAAHLGARPGIAERLIVEVHDSKILASDTMRRRLDAVKALGVAIAVDGFGLGCASLADLRHLPLDLLKISGLFTPALARSLEDQWFVRTLCDLGRDLGVPVAAQWVCEEAEAQTFAGLGIDYLQGALFDVAMPAITRTDRAA